MFTTIASLQCPSCGHLDFDPEKQCSCGFHADESFIAQQKKKKGDSDKNASLNTVKKTRDIKPESNPVIKEVDQWRFSFSPADTSIYLGTPALQSFSLKLTLTDIEELLEFMYDATGQAKTTRKLNLSEVDISELIEVVQEMIEEKRSKVVLNYSDEEVKGIAGLINKKLMT